MKNKYVVAEQLFSPTLASGPSTEFNFVMNSSVKNSFSLHPVIYKGNQGFLGSKAIRYYTNKFKEISPDLVVIRGAGPDGLYAVIGAKKAKVKNILVGVHGLYSDMCNIPKIKKIFFKKFVENRIFRLSTSFYTVCKDAYYSHKHLMKYEKKYIGVVYNAAPDYSLLDKNKIRKEYRNNFFHVGSDTVVGIYVGRITHDKGSVNLAEALKNFYLKNPTTKFRFIFCGTGDAEKQCRNILEEEIQNNKTIFLGVREDIPSLLFASDLFVFPSYRENHPFSILEAASSDIFIISTLLGGVDESLQSYQKKIYLKDNSSPEIEKALNDYLLYKKRIERFDNTNKTFLDSFSGETISKVIEQKYKEVILLSNSKDKTD